MGPKVEKEGLIRAPGRITDDQFLFLESEVKKGKYTSVSEALRAAINVYQEQMKGRPLYLLGESLVGTGPEVAHIDLIIGDKSGPVGQALANALSQLSKGHTPLLAVIRPNLPPKPFTLVVPKVTVENLRDAEKIFGPAQSAIAKAVADAVGEGIIPKDVIDDWVIICSTFIHPKAEDFRKIYHYNYSATKMALSRALSAYPSFDKIMYDKDRAVHPMLGYKVPRLWRPPYLQIALDVPSMERTKSIVSQVPKSDRIILEAGTPLIKKYGASAVAQLREVAKDFFIIADFKTLDVGQVEVDIAFDATADGVVASGLASKETIDRFIYEAHRLGIYAILDMMNVRDPLEKLKAIKEPPDVVILHRAIDVESIDQERAREKDVRWKLIKEIKKTFGDRRILMAVAGGIRPDTALEALRNGADILIVGRYITQSRDIERAVREFVLAVGWDIDLFRVHVE
ncbi:MAG: bifunctional 5,6,7,8-tetrahydromethanopterin hydro-lyase/3-hexulose-6-phosphate synthase [Candidatus Bathyarchaeia archaeon]